VVETCLRFMSALFFLVLSFREDVRFYPDAYTSFIFPSNEFSMISLRLLLSSFFIELSSSLSRLELSVLLNRLLIRAFNATV
jgi:hypothetical protein